MKENYESLEMEVIVFDNEDIICGSPEKDEGDEMPFAGSNSSLS